MERDHADVGQLGRSIFLAQPAPTGRVAVLLHGMSASPTQFASFATSLHDRGYAVLVPRLPRHGYSDRLTDALGQLSAGELKNVTTQALEVARGFGSEVLVVGFSLGGLLAAWAAQFHSVHKVMCVSPFLGVAWVPNPLARAAAFLTMRMPNRFAWWDPIKRELQMPAHGYPRYSTHGVAQAYELVHSVFDDAAAHAPRAERIIVVTNARETTVNNRAVGKLVRRWRKQAPDAVQTFEFSDLPYSHDIIEPLRHPQIVERVYPRLLELIESD